MRRIDSFLNPLLKKKIGMSTYYEMLIKYHWAEIIGKELAQKCVPVRVDKNVLVILSENSTLNHHLLTISSSLVEKINDFIDNKFIKNLFFINGKIKDFDWDSYKEHAEKTPDCRQLLQKVQLNEQSLQNINEFTKNVSDEQLRNSIRKVLINDKKYQKLMLDSGYKKCSNCELLVDKSVDKCVFCEQLDKEKLQKQLKQILLEVPYIDFSECQKYLKCDKILFNDVKNKLIADLIKQIKTNKYTKKDLLIYAMLFMGEQAINLNVVELDRLCEQVKNKP